ncbi:ABC transporter ATP-binding protein [Geminicoccus harenae]|uniref:ABC transporter ATP-binding protein n=1 Tax=Geminicoccus harenae TaxID=2498453 RepID=UPI00168AA2A7|nr:ABC transporter ATP-binding protein [Geminicoccus harenae]
MAQVELQGITKSFGATRVLKDVNLSIEDGEFLTLVGPSGCGKTTLIRIIAGLEQQTSGSIRIDGASIDHLRPHERRIAMVFQSYALYPHMTAYGNMALPLTMARLHLYERIPLLRLLSPRRRSVMKQIDAEVQAVANQLKIGPLLQRRPAQLSGGQRQRVALGRAMVRDPAAFLMDEPLSNLDAELRVHMRTELAELHQRIGATFIYVTHDQVEAMSMSDRIAMMDGGQVAQLGTPSELYERPASIRVAQFIGSPAINILPGQVGPDGAVELLGRKLPISTRLPPGSAVSIGIRPEAIRVTGGGDPAAEVSLHAHLRRRELLGPEQILHFHLDRLESATVIVRLAGAQAPVAVDGAAELGFDPGACHVFDAEGNRVEVSRAESRAVPPQAALVQVGRAG